MAVSSTRLLRPRAIADYLSVTKPKGILPHLITAAAGVFLASEGSPEASRLALTLLGGACLAAAANSFNSYLDRDIDALMERTSRRPLPSGIVSPELALALGVGLSIVGVSMLSLLVSWLAATLAVVALFYYAAYSLFMKRRSCLAAVIGSGVGAMPPLIGWVAVTQRIEMTPIVLSAIIILWTLPHFWALAILRRADFERAGLRVLPAKGAGGWIIASSSLLVGTSAVVAAVAHLSAFYLAAASLLGVAFLALALRLKGRNPKQAAWRLYRYSIFYIAILFAAMIVDKLAF